MRPSLLEKGFDNMKDIGTRMKEFNFNYLNNTHAWATKTKRLLIPCAVVLMPFLVVPFSYLVLSRYKNVNAYKPGGNGEEFKDLFDETVH